MNSSFLLKYEEINKNYLKELDENRKTEIIYNV